MTSKIKTTSKIKDDLKNEDNIKTKDNLKNDDGLKSEDNPILIEDGHKCTVLKKLIPAIAFVL